MKIEKTFDLGPGAYFGGKGGAGVIHTLINQIPKHERFISGFLGRCQVMQWKLPAKINYGWDMDEGVLSEWNGFDINLTYGDFLKAPWTIFDKKTFLYVDPPYLMTSRKNSRDRYTNELTEDDHCLLIEKVRDLKCMVMISHYPCKLYDDLLRPIIYSSQWRKIEYQAQTRNGVVTEAIYMNYPEPAPWELHDTRFLGVNHRKREVSKRRLTSLERKIARLTKEEKTMLAGKLPELLPGLVESRI